MAIVNCHHYVNNSGFEQAKKINKKTKGRIYEMDEWDSKYKWIENVVTFHVVYKFNKNYNQLIPVSTKS